MEMSCWVASIRSLFLPQNGYVPRGMSRINAVIVNIHGGRCVKRVIAVMKAVVYLESQEIAEAVGTERVARVGTCNPQSWWVQEMWV